MSHRAGTPAFRALLFPVLAAGQWSMLQWNPHYQCFVQNAATCKEPAGEFVTQQLNSGLDFANFVEFEDDDYRPPNGWDSISKKCGLDPVKLFFNAEKWSKGSAFKDGCAENKNSPFIVQDFRPAVGNSRDPVIVIGAHFPHTMDYSQLKNAIASTMAATGISHVALMADTNANNGVSNEDIMSRLGVSGSISGTALTKSTCCYPDYPSAYAFDRVITNFVSISETKYDLGPMPSWAKSDELHVAVRGNFGANFGGRWFARTPLTLGQGNSTTARRGFLKSHLASEEDTVGFIQMPSGLSGKDLDECGESEDVGMQEAQDEL